MTGIDTLTANRPFRLQRRAALRPLAAYPMDDYDYKDHTVSARGIAAGWVVAAVVLLLLVLA